MTGTLHGQRSALHVLTLLLLAAAYNTGHVAAVARWAAAQDGQEALILPSFSCLESAMLTRPILRGHHSYMSEPFRPY